VDIETREDGVGYLELTPVSTAIARHLDIDLSHEGLAARNRRGIAIIVHGSPMSGKARFSILRVHIHTKSQHFIDSDVVLETKVLVSRRLEDKK